MNFKIWTKSIEDERLKNVLKSFGGELCDDEKYTKHDGVDVIFGSWKDRDVPHHNLKRDVVKNSKNVVVIETPLLNRGPVKEVMEDEWFRVGLNGFMRNADYPELNSDRKVVKDSPTGSWNTKSDGDYILVVLQLPGDASLNQTNINHWAENTVKEIRKQTDRDVVLRFPQLKREFNLDWVKGIDNLYYQEGTFKDKEVTLDNAYAVVTYSSGMGVESILSGRRTLIESNDGFYCRWTDLSDVLRKGYQNFDTQNDFGKWFNMIQKTQWHQSEIESGACRKAFERMLNNE